MTFADTIQLFEEGYAIVQELKANGSFEKLAAAEAVVEEFSKDPKILDLVNKAKTLLSKV